MWQRFLKDYFSFSAADRNGIILLVIIIILVILLTWFIPQFQSSGSQKDLSHFSEVALSFYETDSQNLESNILELVELFYFDPNNLTADEMRRLGFGDRLIRTTENYLSHGGKFFRKEDMLKIYGMPDSLYEILEPYIRIEKEESFARTEITIREVRPVIELNQADSLQLRSLPGIGNILSSRIVRYRDLLGGFYQTGQLMEVFGISNESFEKLKGLVRVDTIHINKINLHNATFNDLLRHPYIDYNMAVRISGYVKKNPGLQEMDLLLREGILDSAEYSRLKHYLKTVQD